VKQSSHESELDFAWRKYDRAWRIYVYVFSFSTILIAAGALLALIGWIGLVLA
jgi:hypothetical protein